jgi:hypothetical protein
MGKKILIVFGAVLVLLLVIIASRPSTFRIERKKLVAAPAAVVFAQVNDFHRWEAWSPWDKLDPALKRTYAGPEAGVGAVYSWSGDEKVGEGKMTIADSRPNEFVGITVEFLKPFATTNRTELTLKPDGDGTEVDWVMTGPKNFMSKAMGLVMDMDRLVGTDFERGLDALNSVSIDEAAKAAAPPPEPEPTEDAAPADADGGVAADADADGGVAAPAP